MHVRCLPSPDPGCPNGPESPILRRLTATTGLLTDRTSVLLLDVRWLAHPTSPRHSRRSRRAGVPQLRGEAGRWPWRSKARLPARRCRSRRRMTFRCRDPGPHRSRRPPGPGRVCRLRTRTGTSSPPGSRRWTPSSVTVGSRARPRWHCAATHRRARPRSRFGRRRRRRPAVRSSRGWTSPGPSIPWRPSRAACDRSGSWCSPRSTSRRPWRWPRPCSRRGPWTCSWWTCRMVGIPHGPAGRWGTGWAGSRRSPGAPAPRSSSWSRAPSGMGCRPPSRRQAGSGSSCAGRAGSGWVGMSWGSGAR